MLADLAEAAAAAGDLDRAQAMTEQAEVAARQITNPSRQAKVLADLVKAAAAAGDLDRAQELARSITDPDQRTRTLVDLAKGAKPDQARPLLAWALTVDKWQALMEGLVRVDPSAVVAIADEYLSAAL